MDSSHDELNKKEKKDQEAKEKLEAESKEAGVIVKP